MKKTIIFISSLLSLFLFLIVGIWAFTEKINGGKWNETVFTIANAGVFISFVTSLATFISLFKGNNQRAKKL